MVTAVPLTKETTGLFNTAMFSRMKKGAIIINVGRGPTIVTNDLIADFSYHTDFAQVEEDQEVVNLTRFSLFFPEKRQFFTETAGIFDFGKSV